MEQQKPQFDLQLMTLDVAPLIQNCLMNFPRQCCDLNLCNLFTWGQLYKLHYFVWEDTYVIYNPRYHYLGFPFCYNFGAQALAELVKQFRSLDDKVEMILFPSEWIDAHPEAKQFFRFRIHEQWSDYIYLAEKLFTLPGKKLAKKKNLISQFKRLYPDYTVERISQTDRDAILAHYGKWQMNRQVKDPNLTMEFKAVKNAFLFWDKLPLDGLKIIINDEIAAWAVFSPQTTDMVTVHFEKFDPNLKGCAQVINWETARYLKDRYKYINREQDLGIEGLRQAKRSYEPEFMAWFITSRIKQ
ncbi:MAG TPA: phosphatidylglycerol lysyltransferase domain-containing protein [Candidatus Cloacimonadota bacterium]|nr:phosphatidylglycerol lysyltransferase domain-containing protein [Candidatus Cloacimonadota bacterium]HQL15600.1 phosphatidylglycerol lysyltransferase domain-containing protein [Candidatus Cloacimonadota bacterium]